MNRVAIILSCLVLAGCADRKTDARSTFDDTIRQCDERSVRYVADTSGPVRSFRMECKYWVLRDGEVKP